MLGWQGTFYLRNGFLLKFNKKNTSQFQDPRRSYTFVPKVAPPQEKEEEFKNSCDVYLQNDHFEYY